MGVDDIVTKTCFFKLKIMNLRQKLCDPFGGLRTETADQLEQIADEFAIGFADWLQKNDGSASYKELLEMYKKEKGL